ncbi:MAG: TetR/AcrR family transcriptional regulator [Halioglobus sp.]
MPQTGKPTVDTPVKRTRRTQDRAELTRAKLIDAGKFLFSERGFDAVSVRDLETAAGVKRNLLAYHFDDKDTLWRASTDAIIGLMTSEFDQRFAIMNEVSGREALAFLVRFYVYFNAKHPEVSRLITRESTQHSWRSQYLIDIHIRPAAEKIEKLVHKTAGLDRDAFIHWYYIMISSTSLIFALAPECKDLFDVDPYEESRVEAHAEMVVSMLLPAG